MDCKIQHRQGHSIISPHWYYTMSLTVLYFAIHTTVILYYVPDCTVCCSPYHSDIILCPWLCLFCSPYHSDIILCPWLYCILQSIPQWYYTMPFSVLYFASIPQWHYTMPLTVLYFAVWGMDCKIQHSQGHSIISLWYGVQNTVQSGT
jgi:hypothetical protein